MTRINVVPPRLLLDEHLLAEYRELPRVFALAKTQRWRAWAPLEYVLGHGHIRFFYDKTGFLARRQGEIIAECLRRGFNIQHTEPPAPIPGLDNDWTPDAQAIATNVARLKERFRAKPQFYGFWGEAVPLDFYDLAFA